jgi:hypothetical protein
MSALRQKMDIRWHIGKAPQAAMPDIEAMEAYFSMRAAP